VDVSKVVTKISTNSQSGKKGGKRIHGDETTFGKEHEKGKQTPRRKKGAIMRKGGRGMFLWWGGRNSPTLLGLAQMGLRIGEEGEEKMERERGRRPYVLVPRERKTARK